MIVLLKSFWTDFSLSGVKPFHTAREKKELAILNRAWLLITAIQLVCLLLHMYNNAYRSGMLTAFYLDGLVAVFIILRMGYINAAKIAAIAVINLNTVIMSVFTGAQTHTIDFLLLIAIVPLFLFEINNRKLILWGVALSIIPYGSYHLILPYVNNYALPVEEQLAIYRTTPWVMMMCLAVLLYLVYHKNALHEKEMVKKEEELILQKKMYEMILDQIPIAIATFDKNLRFQYVNSFAVKDSGVRGWMTGKTQEEYFEKLKLDKGMLREREYVLKEALAAEKTLQLEESYVSKEGNTKHLLKGVSPIFSDNQQELMCLVGYSLDITDIKKAEKQLKEYAEQLEKKNADMHHFVNATSHDLKTPLRTIVSYLQIIQRNNLDKLDHDSASMIVDTIKSVKHLNQLISDIYQYSIADSGSKPSEITDVNQCLAAAVKQLELVIAEKNAKVTCLGLPVLNVSPSNMETLFNNLIGNAIKYNKSPNPAVNISCSETHDEFIFSVKDNGIGIKPEYCKQVFQMFKRLHTHDEFEGTGVGLAICKKIVENYKGKMWVESTEGEGATFHFSLSKDSVGVNDGNRHLHPVTLGQTG